MLTLKNIYKSYEGKPLLRGISFDIDQGETICLLGPSGSGKSTLLRIISGLEAADEGEVFWEGQSIQSMPPHLRNFGLIFQDYALFPHLNVFENVAFGLKMQKTRKDEIALGVNKALKQVDLLGFEMRSIANLSGGEQQRVALARALAPRPRLLLFDEPLGALDRKLREYLLSELRAILQESQVPVIYVTHDQEEAFALADRVMLLHEGKIVQRGKPAEVYENPVSEWVAEFLGAGNVLEGNILKNGLVETVFGSLKMPFEGKQAENTRVPLLIRPEDVSLGDENSSLHGRVDDIRFYQNKYRVSLVGGFYFYHANPLKVGEEIGVDIARIQVLEK
ncbi:MAG: ABC transporter ATP-binding protein [Anaerolineae bacterium]|jgi:spermidine/putrescine transport system ATP-binding protein|nr:ABC transporter ATP-binding protein [Anaerolineae bacterium]MBT7073594.1 ABC transporter ATP-binding protein [Anaerolineae bacterium]